MSSERANNSPLIADRMSNLMAQQERIFRSFNEIPSESRAVYKNCIRSEAFLKTALPCGIIGACMSYLKIGGIGKGTVILIGLTGYVAGLTKYSEVCLRRHAPQVAELMDNLKRDNQKRELLGVGDESVDQESVLNSFNTPDSDNDNQFRMDSIFEEDTTIEKPVESKPSLTYDDLWKQHRSRYDAPTQRWYQEKYKRVNRPPPKEDEESSEDTFKPETREDNIWV